MLNKTDFILQELAKANLKLIERDIGIPATRMYKWRDGKGKPKLEDVEKLLKYFKNDTNINSNDNITYKANVIKSLSNNTEVMGFSDNTKPYKGYDENSTQLRKEAEAKLADVSIDWMMLYKNLQEQITGLRQQNNLLYQQIEILNKIAQR